MDNRVFWVISHEWQDMYYSDGPYDVSDLVSKFPDGAVKAVNLRVGDSVYYNEVGGYVLCTTTPKDADE